MTQPPDRPRYTNRLDKLADPKVRQSAQLAWAAPLVGLFASIVLRVLGQGENLQTMRLAGGVIFYVCFVAGIVFTTLSWMRASKYQGVQGHAIAGTIVSGVFLLLILYAMGNL